MDTYTHYKQGFLMKLINRSILAACLFAAAGAASATAFSVTDAVFKQGSGYGVDATENSSTATLLDVLFLNSNFKASGSTLTAVGSYFDFVVGSVNFRESNNLGAIVAAERDNLDVSLALSFSAPGNVTETVLATGNAVAGSIQDSNVDYTLTWSPITRTFGTTGQYTISLNNLSFANTTGGAQNVVARVTLTAADTAAAAVPEPGSVALLAIGLLGAGVLRRRAAQ